MSFIKKLTGGKKKKKGVFSLAAPNPLRKVIGAPLKSGVFKPTSMILGPQKSIANKLILGPGLKSIKKPFNFIKKNPKVLEKAGSIQEKVGAVLVAAAPAAGEFAPIVAGVGAGLEVTGAVEVGVGKALQRDKNDKVGQVADVLSGIAGGAGAIGERADIIGLSKDQQGILEKLQTGIGFAQGGVGKLEDLLSKEEAVIADELKIIEEEEEIIEKQADLIEEQQGFILNQLAPPKEKEDFVSGITRLDGDINKIVDYLATHISTLEKLSDKDQDDVFDFALRQANLE